MKTETLIVGAALAVAAGLVLMPRRRPDASAGAMPTQTARVGVGGAGTVWDDQATARYREQLARELSGSYGV